MPSTFQQVSNNPIVGHTVIYKQTDESSPVGVNATVHATNGAAVAAAIALVEAGTYKATVLPSGDTFIKVA